MNINSIPENEVHNVLSVYWQLLQEVEEQADRDKNPLDRHLVVGAYNVLNRIGATDKRPIWEELAKRNEEAKASLANTKIGGCEPSSND